jgi:peptidase C39-like protein
MSKINRINLILCAIILVTLPFPRASRADSEGLDITPVVQESPVWCWVATGEMVFRRYGIPNVNPAGDYQCGIIGALAFRAGNAACNADCRRCAFVNAGGHDAITNMLTVYPQIAYRQNGAALRSRYVARALTKAEMKQEIDDNRPIIAGISPSGFPVNREPEHAVVIVGYDEDDDNDQFTITVNDPYPYNVINPGYNPYRRAGGQDNRDGSYNISITAFKNQLMWSASFFGIEPRN